MKTPPTNHRANHRPNHHPDPERPPASLGPLARALNLPFIAVIHVYRVTLSPVVGRQCRYHPTCSAFGLEAFRLHGPARGLALTCLRILRCHPFAKGGYDPVPIPEKKLVKPHPPATTDPDTDPATDQTTGEPTAPAAGQTKQAPSTPSTGRSQP